MRHLPRAGLAAALSGLCLLGGAAAAPAAPVVFHADPKAPELAVVDKYYGEFVRANPGMKVETAQVDLQGRGVASVAARFVSSRTCAGERCESVVLFYGPTGWRTVLQHTAATLSTAAPAAVPGADGMASLVVDGGQRWIWSGFDHYIPDVASLGDAFAEATAAADPAVAAAARAAFAADPSLTPNLRLPLVDFRAREIDLGSGPRALLVRGYGPGVCGNVDGCPQALLVQDGGSYRTLWTGLAPGDGAVIGSASHGLKDIALADYRGYEALRFDGTAYRVVQTSYPSTITPVP